MQKISDQILEDITHFIIKYENKVDPELLRCKIRFIHQTIAPGKMKTKIRGILNMFTRWSAEKILTYIFEIIQKSDQNKEKMQSKIKPELLSREFLYRLNTGGKETIFEKQNNTLRLTIKSENS
jgi:hypothetical protein